MNKENNTVGLRIRECRKEMGYSQETLAAMLYMKKTTICKYEKDEHDIPSSVLVELAKALYTTPTYLLLGDIEEDDWLDIIRMKKRESGIRIKRPLLLIRRNSEHSYSFYFGKYQIRSLYADCLDYRKNMARDEVTPHATDAGTQQAASEYKSPEAAYGKYSELFRLNDDVIRAVLFRCLLLDDLRIENGMVFANLYTIYLLR